MGRTRNLSVRLGDQVLLTPTGASLGALDPGGLAGLGLDGGHVGGPRPSTERETARLFLLLHGHPTRPLSGDQAERLRAGAGARRATAEEVP